ncbi:glycoside hydrolase family 79 protein [Sphaerobolus stellatus SS14]|nr:glycoside hydrolase family 79 protein [Sphaerobolus stellatus SS14]
MLEGLLLILSAFLNASAALNPSVQIAASAPSDAQEILSTHLSFSLEQDRWPDWVGTESRNEFTYNALSNLASFTGQPPKIRVGADSEDRTIWSGSVAVLDAGFPKFNSITPYPEATTITVGDSYYELSKWLPSGTVMTWGVNLAQDNATNAVNMAKSILRAFRSKAVTDANVKLELIEIGNEPDFYEKHGLRSSKWTQKEYVTDWIHITGTVVNAIGLKRGQSVGLLGASFGKQGYTPVGIIKDGILDSVPGKIINTISQHWYSEEFCSGGDFALSSFMDKDAVRGNLSIFSVDVVEVKDRGLKYILGETNSIACHGAPGVSNTAGASLWVIDYTFQAAVQGISGVFFHQGIGYKYNFLQPIPLKRSLIDGTPLDVPEAPHVMPAYYAAILVARAIGKSKAARIVELTIPEDNVSGYAIYEHNKLVRAVFVNLNAWLKSSTGTRPSVHIPLVISGKGKKSKTAKARRLVIDRADDTEGLLFGGQTYETEDAKVKGKAKVEQVTLTKGIGLRATEAILLEFI